MISCDSAQGADNKGVGGFPIDESLDEKADRFFTVQDDSGRIGRNWTLVIELKLHKTPPII